MFKRLTISLLLMGLAAFGLGAAAFAWFSTSETGNVSISSGTADIEIDVDVDCDGSIQDTVNGAEFDFNWHGIVPGDMSQDCLTIRNIGDGDLDLYVQHGTPSGSLAEVLQFTYDQNGNPSDGDFCGPALAGADGFTQGQGCPLANVPHEGSLFVVVRVLFPYEDEDQNGYANADALTMEAVITGYTSAP